MTTALRFDRGSIVSKLTRTPTGGIRVPARVSRTGVLVYQNADGSSFREYRPESEAFHPDSLKSLEDAVVTVGHPLNEMVSPATSSRYGVGHVRGPGRRDGRFVLSELAVLDAKAIGAIDARELSDISSGYTCRLEQGPGTTPDGERYDAIQRDVRYNHVALLPAGAGRAGRDVSLRLDASAAAHERFDVKSVIEVLETARRVAPNERFDAAPDIRAVMIQALLVDRLDTTSRGSQRSNQELRERFDAASTSWLEGFFAAAAELQPKLRDLKAQLERRTSLRADARGPSSSQPYVSPWDLRHR